MWHRTSVLIPFSQSWCQPFGVEQMLAHWRGIHLLLTTRVTWEPTLISTLIRNPASALVFCFCSLLACMSVLVLATSCQRLHYGMSLCTRLITGHCESSVASKPLQSQKCWKSVRYNKRLNLSRGHACKHYMVVRWWYTQLYCSFFELTNRHSARSPQTLQDVKRRRCHIMQQFSVVRAQSTSCVTTGICKAL